MSAVLPFGSMIMIGGALLRVIGLSPATMERSGTARAIITPTFGGNDVQMTGADLETTTIEAETMPAITGGLDALVVLRLLRSSQAVVPMIRLSNHLLGLVVSRVTVIDLSQSEERFDPRTGMGRRMTVSVTVLHVDSAGGWLSAITGA